MITIEDFRKLDLRVARIAAVDDFAEARRPSYRLTLDVGPYGTRRSSAAIRPFYRSDELVGRLVVCVLNLPPRRIAGFASEVLVLGAIRPSGDVRLLRPDPGAEVGDPIA